MTWLFAFVWTLAIELPIYASLLPFRRWWHVVVATLVVNAITHPVLWLACPRSSVLYIIVGELCVFVVEACVLSLVVPPRRAILAAAIANGASYAAGIVLFAVF